MNAQPPAQTLKAVLEATPERCVVLLLRHADRAAFKAGEPGDDLPLLPLGVQRARTLGRALRGGLGVLHSSPVLRCVQTAAAIADGAHGQTPIVPDTQLGAPGVYVEQGELAWKQWQILGHERVVDHIVAGQRLPGLADPLAATKRLYRHLLETTGGTPGVHVFVTHDVLVTAAAAHLLGVPLGQAEWPEFLEALVLRVSGDDVQVSYRRWSGSAWGSQSNAPGP